MGKNKMHPRLNTQTSKHDKRNTSESPRLKPKTTIDSYFPKKDPTDQVITLEQFFPTGAFNNEDQQNENIQIDTAPKTPVTTIVHPDPVSDSPAGEIIDVQSEPLSGSKKKPQKSEAYPRDYSKSDFLNQKKKELLGSLAEPVESPRVG
jgi:hypothetical protein